MLNLSDRYGIQLHAQHSLQSEDILRICSLASIEESTEKTFEKVSTLNFEQFFGFTFHLFITTESLAVREELSRILPRFGSLSVLSLLKAIHHFNSHPEADNHIVQLATRSLEAMELPPLVVGLANTITAHENDEMLGTLVPILIQLTYRHGGNLFSLIEQQTVAERWNILRIELIRTLAEKRYQERFIDNVQPIKVRVKKEEEQVSEVA